MHCPSHGHVATAETDGGVLPSFDDSHASSAIDGPVVDVSTTPVAPATPPTLPPAVETRSRPGPEDVRGEVRDSLQVPNRSTTPKNPTPKVAVPTPARRTEPQARHQQQPAEPARRAQPKAPPAATPDGIISEDL